MGNLALGLLPRDIHTAVAGIFILAHLEHAVLHYDILRTAHDPQDHVQADAIVPSCLCDGLSRPCERRICRAPIDARLRA